jgi:hypothetical protein
VKLHRIEELPTGYAGMYRSGSIEEYEFLPEDREAIDEAWYWYGYGGYEGTGQLLMRHGDGYALHDMGHCSCYGPTDGIDTTTWEPLNKLRSRCSAGLLIEVECLFNAATEPQ